MATSASLIQVVRVDSPPSSDYDLAFLALQMLFSSSRFAIDSEVCDVEKLYFALLPGLRVLVFMCIISLMVPMY